MNQIETTKPGDFIKKISALLREIHRHEDNPYIRTSPDGTRDIWMWRDTESDVNRVIFHSKRGNTVFRIMEVCRSSHSGKSQYTLMIEATERDKSTIVTRMGDYDENGILRWHGSSCVFAGESPEKSRKDYRLRGYFDIAQVPSLIDFNETVKRFLLNAVSEHPSFETPVLVPYKEAKISPVMPHLLTQH